MVLSLYTKIPFLVSLVNEESPMVQGMRASLAVFHSYPEAMKVLGGEWSIGTAGPWGTRRVRLEGLPPRQFLLRVVDEPTKRTRTHQWHVQLIDGESATAAANPLADAEIILDAQTREGCVLRLTGRHRRDVDEGGPGGVNAYARSLLDQIDRAVSAASGSPSPASQAG
jgi:hypothetical protein